MANSDRKLLEAAARAAGIDVEDHKGTLALIEREGNDYWRTGEYWDPLNDDGDALRLLAAIPSLWSLSFKFGPQVEMDIAWGTGRGIKTVESPTDAGSKASAIRRAIVRAAAALAPTDGETR
jgi:hypothetical protein